MFGFLAAEMYPVLIFISLTVLHFPGPGTPGPGTPGPGTLRYRARTLETAVLSCFSRAKGPGALNQLFLLGPGPAGPPEVHTQAPCPILPYPYMRVLVQAPLAPLVHPAGTSRCRPGCPYCSVDLAKYTVPAWPPALVGLCLRESASAPLAQLAILLNSSSIIPPWKTGPCYFPDKVDKFVSPPTRFLTPGAGTPFQPRFKLRA